MSLTLPTMLKAPFRSIAGPSAGNLNTIPDSSVAPGASFADGFPIQTMTPAGAGGVPPAGGDMNGILHMITNLLVWMNSGGKFPYSSAVAAAIGGYSKGFVIQLNNGTVDVISTINANSNDPNSNMTGWAIYNTAAKAVAYENQSGPVSITASGGGAVTKMLGLGLIITPTSSGTITVEGNLDNWGLTGSGLNGKLLHMDLRYGTGAAPATDDAAVGTVIQQSLGPDSWNPFHLNIQAILAGLTVGTPYWFDLAVNGGSGISGSWASLRGTLAAIEI